MVQVLLMNAEGHKVAEGEEELYERWQDQRHLSIWMNFAPEEAHALNLYLLRFEANEFAIQDILRTRHPPKIEHFTDSQLLIIRGIQDPPSLEHFRSVQISALFGSNWLITYQHQLSPSVQQVYLDLHHERHLHSCASIVVSILQVLSKRYIDWMISVDDILSESEEQLFATPDDTLLEKMITYRKTLRHLKRTFIYHERVSRHLQHEGLPKDYAPHATELNDLNNKFERLKTMVDMYYDQLNDLIEGYISISSHRLNHTMRILTVITAIFVPLSFLAGVYGMNFEFMPELKWKYSYFVLLAMMVSTASLLFIFFKKRKWL